MTIVVATAATIGVWLLHRTSMQQYAKSKAVLMEFAATVHESSAIRINEHRNFPVVVGPNDPEFATIRDTIVNTLQGEPGRRLKPVCIHSFRVEDAGGGSERILHVSTQRLVCFLPESADPVAAVVLNEHDAAALEDAIERAGKRLVGEFWYYPTGERRAKGYFKGGLPHGEWVYFRLDGSKESWGEYDRGTKVGTWTYAGEDGAAHERNEPSAVGGVE